MVGIATMLAEARADGLDVGVDGDRLVVRGPRRCEARAKALLARKVEVMAAMTAQRWGDAAHAVEWFLSSDPPAEPFVLKPAVSITDPAAYWRHLRGDVVAGPSVARDTYGAVRDELVRLYRMFAAPTPPNGPH